ncbi:hypothetical protein DRJ16_03750 [Candidatus Woesearchaeota archaeon]|nr:MAG: hypothetical protein DRJ16_03750 [Candidatus Woesearchaeota archaeon]
MSGLKEVIVFLDKVGLYDVVLPFLLVFTIVFAILEKTKVLGVQEVEGKKITRKNLNAIVAFVAAFLVVASTKIVSVMNQVLASTVLLALLAVLFLALVGIFVKTEGESIFFAGRLESTFYGNYVFRYYPDIFACSRLANAVMAGASV